jgi:cardiolipin synthase
LSLAARLHGQQDLLPLLLAQNLRKAGVKVVEVLPVGAWRIPFQRQDLRMHRKLVVIDDRVGYTGSMNMVDPRFFKQNAGVGQWVDIMIRVQGPWCR